MSGVKRAVPFKKKRFRYALDRKGYSKNKFAKMIFPDVNDENNNNRTRKLDRYMQKEEIAPVELKRISEALDVSPDYLSGSYSITKAQLQDDLGEEFPKIFSEDEFDPEGYHFGSYTLFSAQLRQHSDLDNFADYLNTQRFTIIENGELVKLKFDFHQLDESSLFVLQHIINNIIESIIQKSESEEWKKFAKTGITVPVQG